MTRNGHDSTADEQLAADLGAHLDVQHGIPTLWVDPHDDQHAARAASLGLVEHRRLHQMRIPLPLAPSLAQRAARTRPLRDDDAAAWVTTNNAAFEWHPDQGGWSADQFLTALADTTTPTSDVRILDDPDAPTPSDGGVGGFCWTKLHPDHDPPLGEIYVIAAHPDLHGRGYGLGLTVAGLQHLWETYAPPMGMLYVEADNAAAVALYRGMGFTVHHDNVAYRRAATQ